MYEIADVDERLSGFVIFAPVNDKVAGRLLTIEFRVNEVELCAHVGDNTLVLADDALIDNVRPRLFRRSDADTGRDRLLKLAFRPRYTGQDTLTGLSKPVLMEIDEAISCPPGGLVLRGWIIAPTDSIRAIYVRSGAVSAQISSANSIAISRPDVIVAVGEKFGITDDQCGFVAYAPKAVSHDEAPYLEIELHTGEIGFKTFNISAQRGLEAIRRLLADVHLNQLEIDDAFDYVLGPSITSLNKARLVEHPKISEIVLGRRPLEPVCSLVIPLYGRVDFLEYQIALFSRCTKMQGVELIYVLDDPRKRRELEASAKSVFERFQLPFRLLCLDTNLGFGPASNVGLAASRGDFICFLNSDIFPITDDWLPILIERLQSNPKIGVIGPRLLFEDGSIQHEGCVYLPITEYASWNFVDHVNKGRRPEGGGLRQCSAITGACMVLARSLAMELGGFDQAYVIGDFEDSDLCRRINAHGLSCVIDADVNLYHLERKSQATPDKHWRFNLTLYNAWVHQRRWFGGNADVSNGISSR